MSDAREKERERERGGGAGGEVGNAPREEKRARETHVEECA